MQLTNDHIKCLLFDLDGTLLNTIDEILAALNSVLKQEKLPIMTIKQILPVLSDGDKALMQVSFGNIKNQTRYNELLNQFLQIYRDNIGHKTSSYEGMHTIIDFLESAEISWGIVTNKPMWLAKPLLEKFQFLNKAKCIIYGDTLTVQKPDPAPLLYACQKLKMKPQDCLFIGDSANDIKAGKLANMKTAVALYGYIDNYETSLQWQADYYLNNPIDITNIIPEVNQLVNKKIITHLEIMLPTKTMVNSCNKNELKVLTMNDIPVALYRYLYRNVGKTWLWNSRNKLSEPLLSKYIHNNQVKIFVFYINNTPAGFAEFQVDESNPQQAELLYFGLLPQFIGKGLGLASLLTTLDKIYQLTLCNRIYLKTRASDHPNAISTYHKAGFKKYCPDLTNLV